MKRIGWLARLLCLALCLTLMPLTTLAENAAPTAAPTQAAPAPTVRVLLRRLGLADRADLTLDSRYAVTTGTGADMMLPAGSETVVLVRGGQLYLFYQGMSLCAGASLTLTQSSGEAGQGIRFAEGGNAYPGDLALTVSADGLLTPILTLSVEDYLLGVVPYEMSNSFPLEALKAQAVCARTYALSHVDASAAYDVVDTTNDQVFKGVNLTYTNAIQAVQDTAGVVGVYKDQLASCYYSASNGGQTELVNNVWSGRGDWSYYQMVDDPYDLENPESIVRRATLNKNGTGLSTAFLQLLCDQMAKELAAGGFDPTAAAFRVDGITAMSLSKPKHDAPSRMYSELTLTFTWSGRKIIGWPATNAPSLAAAAAVVQQTVSAPAEQAAGDGDAEISLFASPTAAPTGTPAPAPTEAATLAPGASETPQPTLAPTPTPAPTPIYGEWIAGGEKTLTLQVFAGALSALKLTVSGSNNEMLTVVEKSDSFVLEARRYGHGVGMSQRGAQWMAGMYQKTFVEILSFYYPGMELRKVASGAVPLPSVRPELDYTPGPPATPTPRPTLMPVTGALPEGAYVAQVEGIDDDSSLNLRSEPTTAGDVLMRLFKHQQLVVLGVCEDPEWVHVKTDVVEGYVMVSFLEKVQ